MEGTIAKPGISSTSDCHGSGPGQPTGAGKHAVSGAESESRHRDGSIQHWPPGNAPQGLEEGSSFSNQGPACSPLQICEQDLSGGSGSGGACSESSRHTKTACQQGCPGARRRPPAARLTDLCRLGARLGGTNNLQGGTAMHLYNTDNEMLFRWAGRWPLAGVAASGKASRRLAQLATSPCHQPPATSCLHEALPSQQAGALLPLPVWGE